MRIPRATYRIQFGPTFCFEEAEGLVEYLSELGVSDLYASPVFASRLGSTHGYDVTDPTSVNPELGGEEGLRKLASALGSSRMGILLDIVPNHMAYDSGNAMLMDVLESGDNSRYRNFFDIDWKHVYESIRGRILAPFLGKFYGEALESGEIVLCYEPSGLFVRYYDLKLPLRVESYPRLFTHGLDALNARLGANHPDLIKLIGTLHAFKSLPGKEKAHERTEQLRFAKEMLWSLVDGSEEIRTYVDSIIEEFNGRAGEPRSFDLLDGLLAGECFRLSFWKVATEEINYRRFFNINQLISLRTEDERVLEKTHELVFRLIGEGVVSGLRIDHIDGLYDPKRYLSAVKEKSGGAFVVVEKILGPGEQLPEGWPVEGTTGYEFLNAVNGLFCDGRNKRRMQRAYVKLADGEEDAGGLVAEKKRMIIGKHMAGDIDNLAHLLKTISGLDRYGRDITMHGLRRALVEIMAFFPAYRSYVDSEGASETDRSFIKKAVSLAERSSPGLLYEFSFIEKCLLMEFADMLSDDERNKLLNFVMRFQQFTGPLMAKGFEDTALYVYNRLISLNEVGGDAASFGTSVEEFHRFNSLRAGKGGLGLSATATHDTKRGEDVRARINFLSEVPDEWESRVKEWKKINAVHKVKEGGRVMPDSNDEYFIYQTLVGSWPFGAADMGSYAARIKEYVIKAVREAKVHTAWIKPDETYEAATLAFLDALLVSPTSESFLSSFAPFQRKAAFYGAFASLSQTLLKAASPGIPDIYQGAELWDLNLVDPDNRRPVDFELRSSMLKEIRGRYEEDADGLLAELLSDMGDGRIKLFLLHRALATRAERTAVFEEGEYLPLEVEGSNADHVVAFARKLGGEWAAAVVPRLVSSLVEAGNPPCGSGVWGDTTVRLPHDAPSAWRDMISGGELTGRDMPVGELFALFPAALIFSK